MSEELLKKLLLNEIDVNLITNWLKNEEVLLNLFRKKKHNLKFFFF